jgi:hypothetical protein
MYLLDDHAVTVPAVQLLLLVAIELEGRLHPHLHYHLGVAARTRGRRDGVVAAPVTATTVWVLRAERTAPGI